MSAPPSGTYILGIGAANLDMMGRSAAPLIREDSNPGLIGMSVGGVTHNICANAARLGLDVKLITALGDDVSAQEIRRDCDGAGIDLSHALTVPHHGSSVYLSLHNDHGEMALAISDMRILQLLSVDFLEQKRSVLSHAGAIVMDACLPADVLEYVSGTYGAAIPVFVDPVSRSYARKLSGSLAGYRVIKPNRYELEEISGLPAAPDPTPACARLLERGARRVVASLGRDGCFSLSADGSAIRVTGKPLDSIANATGAGDSFMGGLLYGALRGLSGVDSLLFASGMARLALEDERTLNPNVSVQAAWDAVERGGLRAEVESYFSGGIRP